MRQTTYNLKNEFVIDSKFFYIVKLTIYIRKFKVKWSQYLLINQRHWTHRLCWNMQRLFEWSGHPSWEIRGTGLTHYVGTCKGCLSDQDIPPEKSEALDSPSMLEHAKISVKLIRIAFHIQWGSPTYKTNFKWKFWSNSSFKHCLTNLLYKSSQQTLFYIYLSAKLHSHTKSKIRIPYY